VAKRNYLVEGLSGAGKSAVHDELLRRGYNAISADRAWAYAIFNLRIDDDTMLGAADVDATAS
jgi:predicted ATPase